MRKGATYGPRTIQSTIFFRKLLPNHLHPINLCTDIVAPSAGGRLFALSFCLARENFPMRSKLISWAKETVCSSTAEKRTVIRHLTISGRSNGAISMHHPFRLCMKNTRSVEVCLCSTRRILNRSLHY